MFQHRRSLVVGTFRFTLAIQRAFHLQEVIQGRCVVFQFRAETLPHHHPLYRSPKAPRPLDELVIALSPQPSPHQGTRGHPVRIRLTHSLRVDPTSDPRSRLIFSRVQGSRIFRGASQDVGARTSVPHLFRKKSVSLNLWIRTTVAFARVLGLNPSRASLAQTDDPSTGYSVTVYG